MYASIPGVRAEYAEILRVTGTCSYSGTADPAHIEKYPLTSSIN